MTKKQYMQPEVAFENLQMNLALLTGSIVDDPTDALPIGSGGIGGGAPGDAL